MNKIILYFSLTVSVIVSVYFYQKDSSIVQFKDYEHYLTNVHIEKEKKEINNDLDFWEQKLVANPKNFVFEKKVAGLLARRFKLSGNPKDLQQSDSLLLAINERIPNQVGVLQVLTANAITQHQFRKAEAYITKAYILGEKRFTSSLYLTDVLLERGQFYAAQSQLKQLSSTQAFDYLIRDVKLQDQQGDLTKAIQQMEKALAQAEASGDKAIINWSLTNLADMYGHNAQITKSYKTYLKALEYNPADLHALKGIAWVAFSHDKNTAAAKTILQHLKAIHSIPDYDLLLAEIAEFEGKYDKAVQYQQAFKRKAGQVAYGNMYKTYLADLTSDAVSVQMAQSEVIERPHPMSYDLLAWSHFQNNDIEKAAKIAREQVIDKTEEPTALYHSGIILKAAGQYSLAQKYLKAALGASYELGPVITEKVELELAAL